MKRLLFRGSRRHCPVCGSDLWRLLTFGKSNRRDALCPICESQERHRLNWLYLTRHTDLCDGQPKRLLHVAPEPILEERFRGVPGVEYVSADLDASRAMLALDLMDMDQPDAAFDVVFCSHVLEHVEDDRRALGEIFRILRPGGWALLPVPAIRVDKTDEDPHVTDPDERRRRFGQRDHVRRYGRDYPERLREAGFRVDVCDAATLVGGEAAVRLGLTNGDEVFYCEKPRNHRDP